VLNAMPEDEVVAMALPAVLEVLFDIDCSAMLVVLVAVRSSCDPAAGSLKVALGSVRVVKGEVMNQLA